ncbi:MAG: hypothetical protein AYK19_18795 [Theionarchaea archaeon DG-70-1]|nr:MAG: hypothetical protein AYK19_18795 [Theionarchaea archaeon DG-70-1]
MKGDDVTANMGSKGVQLLKYGKVLYYGGILLVFLYTPLVLMFFTLLFKGKDIPSIIIIVVILLLFGIVIIIYQGSDYVTLYKVVKKLPTQFVIDDFDPVLKNVIIKDERSRMYLVKLFRVQEESEPLDFIEYPEIREAIKDFVKDITEYYGECNFKEEPQYYKVWTPLRKFPHCPGGDLYTRWDLRRVQLISAHFDEKVKALIPRIKEQANPITSLQVIQVAEECGEPRLLATLTKKADSAQMSQTLRLLGMIAHEIEL